MRLLFVDDDEALTTLLEERLAREGYAVVTATDGIQARAALAKDRFDLLLLDVTLPGSSGFEICHNLRSQGVEIPILILTARGEVTDRVTGLKLGADDYLSKPFDVSELLARIEALLRRTRARELVHRFGDVFVNMRTHEVKLSRNPVELTRREFQLLAHLIGHPEVVLSREELLRHVWEFQYVMDTRTVDVHIQQLRQKLEKNPSKPRHFLTVRGIGYLFRPGTDSSS